MTIGIANSGDGHNIWEMKIAEVHYIHLAV